MAKGIEKAPTLQGNYKGKVRGVPSGSGDPASAPTPKEAPGNHLLLSGKKK